MSKADLIAKLEAEKCDLRISAGTKSDIHREAYNQAIDKAIEIVRQHEEPQSEADDDMLVPNLVMLIGRLCYRLKHNPSKPEANLKIIEQAYDYLRRKGLQKNCLRYEELRAGEEPQTVADELAGALEYYANKTIDEWVGCSGRHTDYSSMVDSPNCPLCGENEDTRGGTIRKTIPDPKGEIARQALAKYREGVG